MPAALDELSSLDAHDVQIWNQNSGVRAGGSWVSEPNLNCLSLRKTVQPGNGLSGAVLVYEYGNISNQLGAAFSDVSPLFLLFNFVRIRLLDPDTGFFIYWVGIVTHLEDSDARDGWGTQIYHVAGPEWLLSRTQVLRSVVRQSATPQVINRALPFNISFAGRPGTGNKDPLLLSFSDAQSPIEWTGEDILNYLHTNFFPETLDVDDVAPFVSPLFTWTLGGASILRPYKPRLEVHGSTVLDILHEFIHPRRFCNFTVDYSTTQGNDVLFGTFVVNVHTTTALGITLPSGGSISGNPDFITLSTLGKVEGHKALTNDAREWFSAVVVTGARKGFVETFSIDPADSDFDEGWTSAEQDVYEDGASTAGDYAGLEFHEKWRRNELVRQDSPVFQRFIIKPGRFPTLFSTALRFSRQMPLKERWDYSSDPASPDNSAPTETDFLDGFVIANVSSYASSATAFSYGTSIADMLRDEGTNVTPSNISIRPLEDAFGVLVSPGVSPHWQASGESGNIIDPNPELRPAFDYADGQLRATLYYQTDDYATGRWPVATPTNKNANTLTIRLGDVAFDDTLVQGTVVGIVDGQEVAAADQLKLRDDTDLLEDIARLAYEWYKQPRVAYTLTYDQLVRDVTPGQIVIAVDLASTDVVVTEVNWDFRTSQTSIATAYAIPDFASLVKT